MFRKKLSKIDSVYNKAQQRASKMGVSDMLDWMDMTGSNMAKSVMEFRRNRAPEGIRDIRDSALIIAALADALEKRFDTIG